MIELPDLKQLNHIVNWDAFILDVLNPLCLDQGWHLDFEFIEDLCCVIHGHFNQENPQDWQHFITDFIVPFCQERGWQVEIWPEDVSILIHAFERVKTDYHQLNFFDLCPSNPRPDSHYQYEGE